MTGEYWPHKWPTRATTAIRVANAVTVLFYIAHSIRM